MFCFQFPGCTELPPRVTEPNKTITAAEEKLQPSNLDLDQVMPCIPTLQLYYCVSFVSRGLGLRPLCRSIQDFVLIARMFHGRPGHNQRRAPAFNALIAPNVFLVHDLAHAALPVPVREDLAAYWRYKPPP